MKWAKTGEYMAVSDTGDYAVFCNADDLYTPWHLEHGDWIHIDGRGCDTAKEAAQVCERHQRGEVVA